MHPWWHRNNGLMQGDIGAFLYRMQLWFCFFFLLVCFCWIFFLLLILITSFQSHVGWVHSVHHKSYNPGPFSGLAMHPVEHLLYYTCTLLCLFYKAHPLHFLYAKVRLFMQYMIQVMLFGFYSVDGLFISCFFYLFLPLFPDCLINCPLSFMPTSHPSVVTTAMLRPEVAAISIGCTTRASSATTEFLSLTLTASLARSSTMRSGRNTADR